MRKTLLIMMMAVMALFAQAQTVHTFTDNLVVALADSEEENPEYLEFQPETATIYVTEETDGTYTLSLKNFCLGQAAVGTIMVDNIVPVVEGDVVRFEVKRVIQIAAGDLPDVEEADYMGPELGDVPINLSAVMKEDNLFCVIDIDMSKLSQLIKVTFSEDFTTAVRPVVAEDGNAKVDVYTIDGHLVRRAVLRAEALNGLQAGAYIVGGRKVIK